MIQMGKRCSGGIKRNDADMKEMAQISCLVELHMKKKYCYRAGNVLNFAWLKWKSDPNWRIG